MTTQEFELLVDKLWIRWDVEGPDTVQKGNNLHFESYPYWPVQVKLDLDTTSGDLSWAVGRLDGGEIKLTNNLPTLLIAVVSALEWDPRRDYTVLYKDKESTYKESVWVSTDDLKMATDCFEDCLAMTDCERVRLLDESDPKASKTLALFANKHLYDEKELAEYNKPKPSVATYKSTGPVVVSKSPAPGSWASQQGAKTLGSKQPNDNNSCPQCGAWSYPGWILGKTGWEPCPACKKAEGVIAKQKKAEENSCSWCKHFSVPGFTADAENVEPCIQCNPNNCRNLKVPTLEQACGWDDESGGVVIDMSQWEDADDANECPECRFWDVAGFIIHSGIVQPCPSCNEDNAHNLTIPTKDQMYARSLWGDECPQCGFYDPSGFVYREGDIVPCPECNEDNHRKLVIPESLGYAQTQ
jgi:hypothetical protein